MVYIYHREQNSRQQKHIDKNISTSAVHLHFWCMLCKDDLLLRTQSKAVYFKSLFVQINTLLH